MTIIIVSVIGGFLAFVGGLCATIPQAHALDVTKAKVIDLTHPIDSNTIYWPTETKSFELSEVHKGLTERGFFYASYRFCSPEHGGTHIDAPFHFAERGQTTAAIPMVSCSTYPRRPSGIQTTL